MGAVGIAENVFSVTMATGTVLTTVGASLTTTGTTMITVGTPLSMNPLPWIAAIGATLVASGTAISTSGGNCTAVGTVLNTIGLYGTLACGVTKAAINIANGNLAAGLMALGQTAVSAAMSMVGAGAAGNAALTYVSQGLSVVSSSADMTNNVRAVQGKEASGLASKISTVAGVGSAATGVAGSFGNFAQSGTLSKVAKIGTAVGTALSSTSQMMSTFGGESKAANILGMVGGAINTVSSVASIAGAKKDQANAKNDDANKTEAQATKQEEQKKQETKTKLTKEIKEQENKIKQEQAKLNETSSEVPKYLAAPTEDTQYQPDTEIDFSKPDAYSQLPTKNEETPSYLDMSKFQPTTASTDTKTNKSDLLGKISQGIGAASTVAGAILQNGQNSGNQQQQKKQAPAANLDKRTKDIMKKNKKQRANTKKMLEDQRKIAALKKLRAAV